MNNTLGHCGIFLVLRKLGLSSHISLSLRIMCAVLLACEIVVCQGSVPILMKGRVFGKLIFFLICSFASARTNCSSKLSDSWKSVSFFCWGWFVALERHDDGTSCAGLRASKVNSRPDESKISRQLKRGCKFRGEIGGDDSDEVSCLLRGEKSVQSSIDFFLLTDETEGMLVGLVLICHKHKLSPFF